MSSEKNINYYEEQEDEIDLVELLKDLKRAVFKNIKLVIGIAGVITILGGIVGISVHKKSKIAKAVVQLDYEGISEGKNFDGSPFNKNELVNGVVLKNLYDTYGLSTQFEGSIDKLSNEIDVEGITPDNIKQISETKLKAGQTYVYNPTIFTVSFKYGDTETAKKFLDILLSNSLEMYRKKYLPSDEIGTVNFTEKQAKDYDYYDFVDIFQTKIKQIKEKIAFLKVNNAGSSNTGRRYSDVEAKLNKLSNVEFNNYVAYIRVKKLTKDESLLRINYENKIRMAELSKQEAQERAKSLEGVIKEYKPAEKQIILGNSQENIKLNNIDDYYSNLIKAYRDTVIEITNIDSQIREYKIYLSELKSPSEAEKIHLEEKRLEIMNELNGIIMDTDILLKNFYNQKYTNFAEIIVPPYVESGKTGKLIVLAGMIFGVLAGIIVAFLKDFFAKNEEKDNKKVKIENKTK